MASENFNPELVRNIRRGFRNKGVNMDENPFVIMPVNSVTNPLFVRDVLSDQDSSPTNYFTINQATNQSIANAATTSIITVTVPQGYYYYVWGVTGCGTLAAAADSAVLWSISTSANTVPGNDNTALLVGAFDGVRIAICTHVGLNKFFTRPLMLSTGTFYFTVSNVSGQNLTAVTATLMLEIRKIENRDPEGGR